MPSRTGPPHLADHLRSAKCSPSSCGLSFNTIFTISGQSSVHHHPVDFPSTPSSPSQVSQVFTFLWTFLTPHHLHQPSLHSHPEDCLTHLIIFHLATTRHCTTSSRPYQRQSTLWSDTPHDLSEYASLAWNTLNLNIETGRK